MNISARGLLFNQHKPRLMLGLARDMLTRAQSYYGLMNASMMMITVYTVREGTIKAHLPWMNFIWFFMFIVFMLIVVMIFDYKMVYPSQIAFHQHEAWKHRSPVRKDFEALREQLNQQAKELQKICKTLEDMNNGR